MCLSVYVHVSMYGLMGFVLTLSAQITHLLTSNERAHSLRHCERLRVRWTLQRVVSAESTSNHVNILILIIPIFRFHFLILFLQSFTFVFLSKFLFILRILTHFPSPLQCPRHTGAAFVFPLPAQSTRPATSGFLIPMFVLLCAISISPLRIFCVFHIPHMLCVVYSHHIPRM